MTDPRHIPDDLQLEIMLLAQGRLGEPRAGELMARCQREPELGALLRQERSLESFLDAYETPEPTAKFKRSFWQRFYGERGAETLTGGGASRWLLRVAGPIAAAIVVAFVLVFSSMNSTPVTPKDGDGIAKDGEEPVTDPTPDEIDYGTPPIVDIDDPADGKAPSLEQLRLMRELAQPEFAPLSQLRESEDIRLATQLNLLEELED